GQHVLGFCVILIGSLFVQAAALVAVALIVENRDTGLIVASFFVIAAIVGIVQGVNSVAYYDLIGSLFDRFERSHLLYRRAALAGMLAIAAVALTGYGADGFAMPVEGVHLLWLSAAITLAGGLLLLGVDAGGDRRLRSASSEHRARRGLGDVWHLLGDSLAHRWFRRFVGARILLLSVHLALPFYAIHAESWHGSGYGRLGLFVVATSLAVIVGGYVWPRLTGGDERRAMVAGALLAASAGVLAVVVEFVSALCQPPVYGLVFFAMALAMQGSGTARSLYIVAHAPADLRPRFLAAETSLSGAGAIIIAAAFGSIAHLHGVVWPIALIVVLNIAAALWCRTLDPLRPA
ncbi:MAG: hypothetical protein VW644_02720, partial [Alphaproteobacteria bacterium]